MNPLHWTRQHQLALAVMGVFGAVLGAMLGSIHSAFFSIMQPWQVFAEWLSRHHSYWLWSLLGFLITWLTLYTAQLFRKTNEALAKILAT
jgi:hypothetical protein